MHFIDHVTVRVKAGDGGNGIVSFRQEKFVDRGGPDGGDGGRGGNIILEASSNENTLARFRYSKEIIADPGQPGGKRKKHGRGATDVIKQVPVGTVVTNTDTGAVLADLTAPGQQAIIAKGGAGGFGNAHFISSTRQAPRVAEKGEPGEEFTLQLELKLIADVGLVGLPNAGKSTFLSVVSNARPEIGDYAFTTLTPNLGVVDIDSGTSVLVADIPGLIEGAAEGKGLGDEFLRHVERTRLLVHLVDAYQDDVAVAYRTIQTELAAYAVDLSTRPQLVVLSKTDGLDDEIIADLKQQLLREAGQDVSIYAMSAQTHQGVKELLYGIKTTLDQIRQQEEAAAGEELDTEGLPVLTVNTEPLAWEVSQPKPHHFVIKGRKIERFAVRTDFDNDHSVARLRDIMRKMGIMHELRRRQLTEGDTIQIGQSTFTY